VTYSYTATWSSVDGQSPAIQVSDDTCAPVVFTAGDTNGNSRLDAGERWNYSCTHTLPPHAPEEANPLLNNAQLNGILPGGSALDPVTASVPLVLRHQMLLNLQATAIPSSAFHDDEVTFVYTATVTSEDDSPSENVALADSLCTLPILAAGDTNGDLRLDVNEEWRYTCTWTVPPHTSDEPAAYTSTATLTGSQGTNAADAGGAQTVVTLRHRDGALNLSPASQTLTGTASAPLTVTFALTYASVDGSAAFAVFAQPSGCAALTLPPTGDEDEDSRLDVSETWRYDCRMTFPTDAPVGATFRATLTASAVDQDGRLVNPAVANATVTLQAPVRGDGKVLLPMVFGKP
jgi:hypothetical protein